MQQSLVRKETSNEWLEFMSQMGIVNLEKARTIFLSGDYSQLTDLSQKALFIAGRGKTLSLEGNLPGAKISFDEAQMIAETRNAESGFPTKDEILAYISYEKGGFYTKYGEAFNSLSFYRSARRLAESPNLIKTIDYQLYAADFENGRRGSVEESKSWINYFSENNMQIMHLISRRRMASYFRLQKKYEQAISWIDSALRHAHSVDSGFMVDQFLNVRGYILYFMGEMEQAREIYFELLPRIEGHYLKSAVLENLTLTYYKERDFEYSSEYIGQAISHSQKYKVLSRLPAQCLFMGELQRDQFQVPELATKYFELGYLAALELAEHGFALKGDRLKVVKAFENRPKTGYSIPDSLGVKIEPFAFSMGRKWREILDLFHFSLLRAHLMAGDGSAELPAILGLKASTYYAIKRRLTNGGYDFDPTENRLPIAVKGTELNAFRVYVSKLHDLEWTEANSRFETEIIEYLFKHAGYQKTKLAEDLDISYPTVLQKTKSLTMS